MAADWTAAERARRERVRLAVAEMIEAGASGPGRSQGVSGCRGCRVNRWRRALAAGGREALASKRAAGAQCKLAPVQVAELEQVLDAGPGGGRVCRISARRWRGSPEQCWRRFGVQYTLAGMAVLLHRLWLVGAGPGPPGGGAR